MTLNIFPFEFLKHVYCCKIEENYPLNVNFRFVDSLDLCGQQLDTLCKRSLGFPAVLPNSDYDVDPASTKQSEQV